MRWIPWRGKLASPVLFCKAVGIKVNLFRQRLFAQPLDRSRRGIKHIHTYAELADQFEFKGNVLSDSKRINNAGNGQTIRANAPSRAVVSQPQFCAFHLPLLPEISHEESADNSLKSLVGIGQHQIHSPTCAQPRWNSVKREAARISRFAGSPDFCSPGFGSTYIKNISSASPPDKRLVKMEMLARL